ncbi:16S rRNA (guanine(527)-N(7))-methyltransferase RsmG [bacterium]|nr:16S rRNA (guanine(527)-N(7))-methyltransferase RsmG [bacterium]
MEPWQLLTTQAAEWGVPLDDAQVNALKRFYDLLIEGNRRANLTRITDEREAVVKHFLDSLSVLRAFSAEDRAASLRFIDVGAGAGFPGIPLMALAPAWSGTQLEATRKKVDFMSESIEALGLSGRALHGRAEELAQTPEHREKYDLVFGRAVAELNVLSELCLPFLKQGGRFVAMKGAGVDEEVSRAQKALKTLGGEIRQIVKFSLPEGFGERALVVVEKTMPTPKAYPRRAGQPAAKPLC